MNQVYKWLVFIGNIPFIYLDSCVYILVANRNERIPLDYWDVIYGLARLGGIKIAGSTLTLKEVRKDKTPGDLTQVMKLLKDKDLAVISKIDKDTLMGAASLRHKAKQYSKGKRRQYTLLKKKDSWHMQSAIDNSAVELHTTDRQILGLAPEVLAGRKILIVKPADSDIYEFGKWVLLQAEQVEEAVKSWQDLPLEQLYKERFSNANVVVLPQSIFGRNPATIRS